MNHTPSGNHSYNRNQKVPSKIWYSKAYCLPKIRSYLKQVKLSYMKEHLLCWLLEYVFYFAWLGPSFFGGFAFQWSWLTSWCLGENLCTLSLVWSLQDWPVDACHVFPPQELRRKAVSHNSSQSWQTVRQSTVVLHRFYVLTINVLSWLKMN